MKDKKLPVACRGCKREGLTLQECRIRIVQFSVFNRKCPRELAEAEAITPKVEPLLLKTTKEPTTEILTSNLRLESVALGVFTPRMAINQRWVQELAEDIKRSGQQKAIIVQYQPNPPYPLVDGEHRVAALKLLRQPLVRAEIKPLSDEEAAFLAMKINEMHGLRLDDLERGKQLHLLQEKHGWSQEKLAQMYGRSQDWVSQRVRLYVAATPELKNNITTRVVMFTHAREIAQLPKEEQSEVVEKVKEAKLSSRATKALVQALKEAETPEEKQQILEKPIESYKEIYKPEALERALAAKPEEAVFERFDCPCGCGYSFWVDWNMRRGEWKT